MNMNLLPFSFRKKISTDKILKRWIVVWVICTVGGASATLASWAGQTKAQSAFQQLEQQALPIQKLSNENLKLTSEISAIQKRESILEDVSGISQPLSYFTLISQSAAATNNELLVHRLSITEAEEAVAAPKKRGRPQAKPVKAPPPVKYIQVQLSGMATDHGSVAVFVTSLRDSGAFRSVELKSSTSLPLPHGNGRKFEVICKR